MVVEGQVGRRERFDADPRGCRRVAARSHEGNEVGPNQREVGDRDDPHARVPVRASESSQLVQVDGPWLQGRLLFQLPRRSGVQVLSLVSMSVTDADEATGERPGALEWVLATPDQEHAKLGIDHAERDDVDSHRRPGKVRRPVVSEELRLGSG